MCAVLLSLIVTASIPARADILLQDDFSSNTLDPQKWTVNTNIQRGPASIVVANQRVEITNRGHLITVPQFDPRVLGPLDVTGTWVFGRSGLPAGDFMQVLTRSDGVPDNTPVGETSNGIEFLANANGSGGLQIVSRVNGVATVLASTSMILNANETYGFDVRDDGLSVSLTFRELGGAQVAATVSATSNLTFSMNHVVFHNRESNNGGFGETSYLDNVMISSSVPEPSSLVLGMTASLLGLASAGWRRVCRRSLVG